MGSTSVEATTSVERVAVAEAAVAEVTVAEITMAVAEITMMEPIVTKVSAVRDEGVMVVECPTAMPVVPPVTPAPPKSSEVPDSKSNTERESDAAPKNTGHRIPAWVGNNRRTVHQPRIIGWHIDHFRVSRFDNDCVSLRRYLLLFVVVQMASLARLLTHRLHCVCHILRLVGICVAKR